MDFTDSLALVHDLVCRNTVSLAKFTRSLVVYERTRRRGSFLCGFGIG